MTLFFVARLVRINPLRFNGVWALDYNSITSDILDDSDVSLYATQRRMLQMQFLKHFFSVGVEWKNRFFSTRSTAFLSHLLRSRKN